MKYTREEIKQMSIEWIVEILFAPRDPKTHEFEFMKHLSNEIVPARRKTQEETLREMLWLRGTKIEEIAEQIKTIVAQQQEMLKLVYQRPQPHQSTVPNGRP